MLPEWKKSGSLLALLLANGIPVFGVLFLSWDLTVIMILFWLENLIIGGYALVKIFMSRGAHSLKSTVLVALFFTVHYGLFWSVHGVFLASLLGVEVVGSASQLPAPLMLGPDVVLAVWPEHQQELTFGVFALILSHGFSLYDNFIRMGEYKLRSSSAMPTEPYRRVLLLHFTLLFGAIIVEYFGRPMILLVLLVLVKTLMDAWLHLKAHKIGLQRI